LSKIQRGELGKEGLVGAGKLLYGDMG
jgi:hypothetical protein